MKQMRRAMHFDFHTMPGIEGLLSEFDAEDFAKKLNDAHVEYINFPARCNIGFSYYNTKIGVKYPGLERDILAETVKACHKYGIGVTAYINIGLNHELARKNYGWCRIDGEGRIYGTDKVNNFFRSMCMNSDYREYMYSEIRELLEYDVDGVFCDCLVTRPCYCPRCMEKMNKLGIDFHNERAVIDYQDSVIGDVFREIRTLVPENLYLYINSNRTDPKIHSHAEVECLPSSKQWGSDYFYPTATYARTRFDKLLYMTGRFQDNWGDFGGVKTLESMQNDLYDALTTGYGISISDHLHPKKGLFDEVISRAAKVFEEKLAYEPYTEGTKPKTELGILIDKKDYRAPEYLRGAARMLCEAKITYNAYDPDGDFSSEKLLIIPRALELTGALAEKLHAFRENGGKFLFIGEGIDLAVQLGYDKSIKNLRHDPYDNSYFKLPESDMLWAAYAPSRIFDSNGATPLAHYVEGMFNLTYDGQHTYYYRPQGNVTESLSAASDGDIAYIAYNALDAYASNFLKENKTLVIRAIDSLLPDRELLTEGLPSTATVGLSEGNGSRIVHIKATYPSIRNSRGIVEDHAYIPKAKISVKGEFSRVSLLPADTEIPFEYKDGKTTFTAQNILGYAAYMLK